MQELNAGKKDSVNASNKYAVFKLNAFYKKNHNLQDFNFSIIQGTKKIEGALFLIFISLLNSSSSKLINILGSNVGNRHCCPNYLVVLLMNFFLYIRLMHIVFRAL